MAAPLTKRTSFTGGPPSIFPATVATSLSVTQDRDPSKRTASMLDLSCAGDWGFGPLGTAAMSFPGRGKSGLVGFEAVPVATGLAGRDGAGSAAGECAAGAGSANGAAAAAWGREASSASSGIG